MTTRISWDYNYSGIPYDVKFLLIINNKNRAVTKNTYYDYDGIVYSVHISALYSNKPDVFSTPDTTQIPSVINPLSGTEIGGTCDSRVKTPTLSFDVTYAGFKKGASLNVWILNPYDEKNDYFYGRQTGPNGTFTINTEPPWDTPDFQVQIIDEYNPLNMTWVNLTKDCVCDPPCGTNADTCYENQCYCGANSPCTNGNICVDGECKCGSGSGCTGYETCSDGKCKCGGKICITGSSCVKGGICQCDGGKIACCSGTGLCKSPCCNNYPWGNSNPTSNAGQCGEADIVSCSSNCWSDCAGQQGQCNWSNC